MFLVQTYVCRWHQAVESVLEHKALFFTGGFFFYPEDVMSRACFKRILAWIFYIAYNIKLQSAKQHSRITSVHSGGSYTLTADRAQCQTIAYCNRCCTYIISNCSFSRRERGSSLILLVWKECVVKNLFWSWTWTQALDFPECTWPINQQESPLLSGIR